MGYFYEKDNFICLQAEYAEFYIPMSYFDKSDFAEDMGNIIKCLGILDVGIFEGGRLKEMKILNVPSKVELNATDYEMRTVNLPGEEKPVPCKVLKYYQGNQIMPSTIIEDSTNAETYLKFVTQGKVPTAVPYSRSLSIWIKNQKMNHVNFGVPSVILELILSVAYRDKKDPTKRFAVALAKNPNLTDYDYKMASIRQICQYTSTFTALTFEDFDSMLTTSLNRTRLHKQEVDSPLEQIIKM